MNGWTFTRIIGKYKKCPKCGASYKTNDLCHSLENEIITIGCKCGWEIKVDVVQILKRSEGENV